MNEQNCKIVILAGGFGTRLKGETEFKPKPLIKIGGKPIIWHIMKIYAKYGYTDFVIAGGYKVEEIKQYFMNFILMHNDFTINLKDNKIDLLSNNQEMFNITIVDTGLNTLTGGRIKRLRDVIGENRFMVTYGDGVANIDIDKLMEFHESHGKLATVTGVRPSSRFGELNVKENLVVSFEEKPQVSEGYINGGFFIFEPTIFDYIQGDKTSLEREPLERLSREGHLAIYKHNDFWRCMDTHKDMDELNTLWEEGNAKWKIWE